MVGHFTAVGLQQRPHVMLIKILFDLIFKYIYFLYFVKQYYYYYYYVLFFFCHCLCCVCWCFGNKNIHIIILFMYLFIHCFCCVHWLFGNIVCISIMATIFFYEINLMVAFHGTRRQICNKVSDFGSICRWKQSDISS